MPEAASPATRKPAEERCIPTQTRARIADCSAAESRITRADAREALWAADLAVALQGRAGRIRDVISGAQVRRGAAKAQLLAPRTPLPAQQRALDVLSSYICRHGYDLEVVYALARVYSELNRFAEAAVLFERVAEGPAEDELPPIAFMRWLESLNVLGSHFAMTSCFDEMVTKVPIQRDRLCAFDLVHRHPEREKTCTLIGRINADIDRLH